MMFSGKIASKSGNFADRAALLPDQAIIPQSVRRQTELSLSTVNNSAVSRICIAVCIGWGYTAYCQGWYALSYDV